MSTVDYLNVKCPMDAKPLKKRTKPLKPSRIELLQEFDRTPLTGLVSSAAFAAFLGCSKGKLERARWDGSGPPFLKIGHSVRYRKVDALKYLDGKMRCCTVEG